MFKKAIDQYIQGRDTTISDLAYVQNCRVRELLKYILAIQKQLTNRPQVITNQTDNR